MRKKGKRERVRREGARADTSDTPRSVPTYRFAGLEDFRLPLGCRLVGIEITDEAMRQLPRLRRIPARVDSILGQAAQGELGFRLSLFGDPKNEAVLTRLFDRVVLAIIAASLGLGSTFLLNVRTGPHLGTDVSINAVLGYVGLLTSAVLVMRIIAGIIRDGNT